MSASTEHQPGVARRHIPDTHVSEAAWPTSWPAVLTRVHAARGSSSASEAIPKLDVMPHFSLFKDMDAAASLLQTAIENDQHIVVTADFDCDGATACAVAVRGLRMLGAKHVSYAVPDRSVHGYGLTPALVKDIEVLAPDLIVTVDHGIACFEGIRAAKAAGWHVLVTDHHLPGERLPDADAIINPNQVDDPFPSKALAGVGVMFYVLLALRARMDAKSVDLAQLLDLVAVGTVADMVRLDGLNRALVNAGLNRIRAGKVQPGIAALATIASRALSTLSPTDIGFGIAPRINAAGRLEDMRIGIECLLSEDAAHATELARILDDINSARRQLQSDMLTRADSLAEPTHADDTANVVCVFDADWHPGVIGLVASKLKEKLHRPVFAFAPSGNDDGQLRGSARSIPGFHIRDAIAWVDAQHPGLILRFGGHGMAAGLSLDVAKLEAFQSAVHVAGQRMLTDDMLQSVIETDGPLSANELTAATAVALRDGGIWGQGYPEPQFDDVFDVVDFRWLKEKHLKLKLRKEGRAYEAIQFNAEKVDPADSVRLVYQLALDDWRGGDAVQLVVRHRLFV